jgi:type IV secretion system protein VirD4
MAVVMIWQGVPFGFADDDGSVPITYTGNAPVLVFGPPGSSKTVGFIMNQLLDDTSARSYIVIDPKGEIAAVTARFRRQLPGHSVRIINPYGLLTDVRPDLRSDGWNPLDDLDPASPAFGDDCAARGDALIKTNASESQPIFPNSARSALTAGINYEVRTARLSGETPSLPAVRAMLTLDTEQLVEQVDLMIATGDPDIVTRIRKFRNDNREIQSIKSNIETDTSWMTAPMRRDMTVKNGGVDFRIVKQRPTIVYVILPTSELVNKASYLRLLLSTALRHLYRHDGLPCTLLVEEAFVLGHLTELENACSILRGYNSRLVTVFQSLQQIKKLYPDTWELFGLGAVLGFRPGDVQTAKWMVEKAGKVTMPILSAADPSGRHDIGVRPSWQQKERDRISLQKMFGMPMGKALVWLPNEEVPRVARIKGYFEIAALNRFADANPLFRGGGQTASRNRVNRWAAVAIGVVLLFALLLAGR